MTLPMDFFEKIQQLPEQQQFILQTLVDEFARADRVERGSEEPGWLGCLQHLGASISEEDIAAARREMWGNLPRISIGAVSG